jgi:UDP-2-acetamido-2,6-beta-L-arabino-hexul-4-ose reductase
MPPSISRPTVYTSYPEIPDGSFEKKLYSMYCPISASKVAFPLKMNVDARGSFTELLRTANCGQVSVNISKPGITKGQHCTTASGSSSSWLAGMG